MTNALEKSQNLSLSVKDERRDIPLNTADDWVANMQPHEQEAIDTILDYLIQNGSRPYVEVKGDRLDIVTAITQTMRNVLPSVYQEQLKIMNDYMARWLCAYFDHHNIQTIEISFGFGSRDMMMGQDTNHGA